MDLFLQSSFEFAGSALCNRLLSKIKIKIKKETHRASGRLADDRCDSPPGLMCLMRVARILFWSCTGAGMPPELYQATTKTTSMKETQKAPGRLAIDRCDSPPGLMCLMRVARIFILVVYCCWHATRIISGNNQNHQHERYTQSLRPTRRRSLRLSARVELFGAGHQNFHFGRVLMLACHQNYIRQQPKSPA
jgi:hypothetical protein